VQPLQSPIHRMAHMYCGLHLVHCASAVHRMS
jgi:hypothetical protein